MSAKEKKLRNQFRPKLFVQNIHQVENYDPTFDYKNVIFTYRHDPGRVDRYMDLGWEIVETTETTQDDRSFTPNSKDKKLRMQPCVTTTTDGHEQVLMRILKTKRAQNQLDKKLENERLRSRQSQRRGEKIEKRGNEIITTGTELDENII